VLSVPAQAAALEQSADGCHVVRLDDGTAIVARAVVIATGARYRRLGVPHLEDYEGVCVFYAATEAEALTCIADPVVVVGGGNSAGQATTFLATRASEVHLLVRSDNLGRDMSRYLVDRIQRIPNVDVRLRTEVRKVEGRDGRLEAVVAENAATGARERLPARALFVFIGAVPYAQWLGDELALDEDGFIRTGADAVRGAARAEGRGTPPYLLETSRRGVFAAGDVRSGSIKRVASAVGEGAMAVRYVHEYLDGARRSG
jgi:thioredoxin reductase (NADPH)